MSAGHDHDIDFFGKTYNAVIFEMFDLDRDFFFCSVDGVEDPALESNLYLLFNFFSL